MSFVNAIPLLVQSAAHDLAGIGSSLADTTATVSGPTTGIAAAAQDEVSLAIASLFGNYGLEFQALSAQARSFHTQFVTLLNASTQAYMSAEVANAASAAASIDPLARWGEVIATTSANAQKSFGAVPASLNTLADGGSTWLGQLVSNPGAALGNLQNAAKSVFLVGADDQLGWSVAHHTTGGVTFANNPNPGNGFPYPTVPIDAFHLEMYQGLVGLGDFGTGDPLVKGLTNFVASPASGVLLGALGPFVSPAVALWNSAGAIFGDITGGNPMGALGELINIPANVIDGFFNGATLNLDPLAPLFDPFVTGGSSGGETLEGLSYAFGGLFTPGEVVTGASGPQYYGTGGSMLNALGVDFSFHDPDPFAGGNLSAPGNPVGPIAGTAGLISVLGNALGGTLLVPLPT